MEKIKKISINDKDYPACLKKISDAPKILFVQGKLIPEEKCFAVVGTRIPSSYGKQVAAEISADLANAGLTIVSGLAPGIDTISHQAVVEENKRTVAVLGTGLDESSIYPKENIPLTRKIIESGGCLISEYPAGTRGTQFTFPKRNRIISGLSLGVLVVEAKQKSGALITASWAKSQKRKVFAVPGSIYSSVSKGSHYLLKNGAQLTENAADILKELNLGLSENLAEKIIIGENEEEQLILAALKEGALYIDKIIEKTKLPARTVAATLAILEIKGIVKNLGGNSYAIGH